MTRPEPRVLSQQEIQARLGHDLPRWACVDGRLDRTYHTGGWQHTMLVVNAIAHLAEAAFHHPELVVSYSKVRVQLNTHSLGGISEKDFELAMRIESHVTWQPASQDALQGYEADTGKPWTR